MMQEFIAFVHSLFPQINPYVRERVNESIKQFERSGQLYDYFLSQPLKYLAQGDIIGELPFVRYDPDGGEKVYKTKGILLSNTCDCENDKTVVFAPLLPAEQMYGLKKNDFKTNMRYSLICFPDTTLSDYVIDLTLMNSYPKDLIARSLEEGRLTKSASLNKFGYYLFLCNSTFAESKSG